MLQEHCHHHWSVDLSVTVRRKRRTGRAIDIKEIKKNIIRLPSVLKIHNRREEEILRNAKETERLDEQGMPANRVRGNV